MPDNGICERFHRTVLDEFYRVVFRKKIYRTIDELQTDLDGRVEAKERFHPIAFSNGSRAVAHFLSDVDACWVSAFSTCSCGT